RSVDEGPGSGNQVTILIAFELERNHTMNRLVPVDNSLIFIN
ncbi:MAG: hypothetical protein, partial [Olavius algarvensis Gamma 1 endosymbiont]